MSISPLSYFQLGIWWEQQLDPTSATYNTSSTFRVRSPIDPAILRAAWQAVVDRHPGLRTTFGARGGVPFQETHAHREAPFTVHDASSWSDEELRRQMRAEYERPFDLEVETTVQLVLYRRAPDDFTFFFRMHHILQDHGSTDLVHDELFQLYAAKRDGREVVLPPLRGTHADFVLAQKQFLESPAREGLTRYWSEQLAGASGVLDLPTDHVRPPRRRKRGASLTFPLLDGASAKALSTLAHAAGSSVFKTMLAAFYTLLHRYTGQEDILVTTPVDCRAPEHDGVVGDFANMLVLRARIARDTSFRSLVQQVARTVSEGVAHKDLPFAFLLDLQKLERDPSRTPLAQTSFTLIRSRRCPALIRSPMFEPPDAWRAEVQGLTLEGTVPLAAQDGHFDLTLWTWEIDGKIVGEFKYDVDLFERATIERMVEHFRLLLEAAIASPDRPLRELPLLSPAEKTKVLVAWNDTRASFSDGCVHWAFERHAAESPDRPAVAFADTTLTYGALNTRANQLARRLQGLGVKEESLVAISLERSVEVVIAMLAVLKAGGAFVPLDPSYPNERLELMLEDSRPVVLVTQSSVAPRLASRAERVLLVDEEKAAIAREEESDLPRTGSAESLAYVIYTSGSTGRPKGVLLRHRGATNLAEALGHMWKLGGEDRLLAFASFSFDACIADIFPTLTAGALLHLGDADAVKGGDALHRRLRASAITHVTLPPSVWSTLSEDALPALKVGVSAGEPCPAEIAARWRRGRTFFNNYGPTEITVCATVHECTDDGVPSIGRPIANTRAYVLDGEMEPVPIGVPGELYIGGVGVARGYLHRPELTRERFVQNPHVEEPDVLYRTGDLARFLPSGDLEFLGRRDTQVKLRGYRIELGEVEAATLACPGVREAAVLVRAVGGRDRLQLVAYVVAVPDAPTIAALRSFLEARLPAYMVPSHFVRMDAFPLTPNGKVDRAGLKSPVAHAEPSSRVLPRDERERAVAAIWCRALKVETLGVHDNFFHVGGDSLLALEVVHELSVALSRNVPASALLAAPTIAELCAYVDASTSSIVTLREGPAPALFCFHPTGGDVMVYGPFASAMEPRASVLGVRSRALGGAEKESATLREMAAEYAQLLTARQPEGAFRLAGWSMGGLLAAEVAAQLEDRGRTISFLGLLDATTPEMENDSKFYLAAGDLGAAAALFGDASRSTLESVGARLLAIEPTARRAAAIAIARELGLGTGEAITKSESPLFAEHAELLRAHDVRGLRCDLHLWIAKESAGARELAAFWRTRTVRSVSVAEAEGTHYSMMRAPNVAALAKAVWDVVRCLDATKPTPPER